MIDIVPPTEPSATEFSFEIMAQLILAGDPAEDMRRYSIAPGSLNSNGLGEYGPTTLSRVAFQMSPIGQWRAITSVVLDRESLKCKVGGEGTIVLFMPGKSTVFITTTALITHDQRGGRFQRSEKFPTDCIEYGLTKHLAGINSIAIAMTTGNAFYARQHIGEDITGQIYRGAVIPAVQSSDFLRPQTPESEMMQGILHGLMPRAHNCPVGFDDIGSPMLFVWAGNFEGC